MQTYTTRPDYFDNSLAANVYRTKELVAEIVALPTERADRWAKGKGWEDAADWLRTLRAWLSDVEKGINI